MPGTASAFQIDRLRQSRRLHACRHSHRYTRCHRRAPGSSRVQSRSRRFRPRGTGPRRRRPRMRRRYTPPPHTRHPWRTDCRPGTGSRPRAAVTSILRSTDRRSPPRGNCPAVHNEPPGLQSRRLACRSLRSCRGFRRRRTSHPGKRHKSRLRSRDRIRRSADTALGKGRSRSS
jgi:hypothetical protein